MVSQSNHDDGGFDGSFCAMQSLAATELKMPVVVTEQYPKALGNTVPEVSEALPKENTLVVAKTDFSMIVPDVVQQLDQLSNVKNILLLGIETHVCVLQTTLDLIGTHSKYSTHVASSCTKRCPRPHDVLTME